MKLRLGSMLGEVLASVLKKPATIAYPGKPFTMPDAFRGKIIFDPGKCIGCKLCMRDCPSDAIHITKVADKRFRAGIDLDHCIYCAQCVEVCPKQALTASREFELASLDRESLHIVYEPQPEPPADV